MQSIYATLAAPELWIREAQDNEIKRKIVLGERNVQRLFSLGDCLVKTFIRLIPVANLQTR